MTSIFTGIESYRRKKKYKFSLKKLYPFWKAVFVFGFFHAFFFGSSGIGTQALTIEPNHDKPCVVGDAWAEECMSCVCSEGRIATCRPSFCATRLKRDLDDCKDGEMTKIDCNTCQCKNNVRVCTKYNCDNRKSKKKEKRGKRTKGKVFK